jgi:hypothetical protein
MARIAAGFARLIANGLAANGIEARMVLARAT